MKIIQFIKEKNHERLARRKCRKIASCRADIPAKVAAIRRKKEIKVLFVLYEAATWKTEALYLAMKKHPRFKPLIGVTLSASYIPSQAIATFNTLTQYLKSKGYEYDGLSADTIMNKLQPDIVFYPKPYHGSINNNIYIDIITQPLLCHIQYAFNTRYDWWAINQPAHIKAWHCYFENSSAAEVAGQHSYLHGKNYRVTGLPIEDELMSAKENWPDPWKKQDHPKKRIIWAPHHSINEENWIHYSTFLECADSMLELAKKYKEEVQFIFKPHPILSNKLDLIWGKEKRVEYYSAWAEMENTQLSEGKYIDIFKYSDAMIHDCSSFMIEYHYTLNPVMYLVSPTTSHDGLMPWAQEAFNLHYKGQNIKDVEAFIQNVINGTDPMKESREAYYRKYLVPPHGKTASENIIDAILYK